MLKNKLCLLLALCLLASGAAAAESVNIISNEMIQTETVNYSKTAVVEAGEYTRDYNASATEYYPYTFELAAEIDNASFLKYHVARSQKVGNGSTHTTGTDYADLTHILTLSFPNITNGTTIIIAVGDVNATWNYGEI